MTPPAATGGGEIEITNHGNVAWRTKSPKVLKSLQPFSVTIQYDQDAYTSLMALINNNQSITVTWPDTATLVFYGWVDEFTPSEMTEGEEPTAELVIIPSLQNAGVETAPVFTAA